jgi:S1-C subfamily serine protease
VVPQFNDANGASGGSLGGMSGGYDLSPNGGTFPGGSFGGDSTSSTASSSSNQSDGPTDAAAIARDADAGIVDITTTVATGQAAGTGMVLTSNGEVLTNNHVIDGATSISVRDVGNGKTYKATVVGYDRSKDVAVLQLVKAAGLTTVKTASSLPSKGAAVVGIGNAGGTGGTPTYAGGSITGINKTITASDAYDGTSERLTGLLRTDADIQAGDSGGPLVDAAGEVVGMDTAATASSNGFGASASTDAARSYAIPILTALNIADEIESGDASSTVHIGSTAELGVYVSGSTETTDGAVVEKVNAGDAAAKAGIVRGDTITSVNGVTIRTTSQLTAELARLIPGQTVAVSYATTSGAHRTVRVTLGTGAPQ